MSLLSRLRAPSRAGVGRAIESIPEGLQVNGGAFGIFGQTLYTRQPGVEFSDDLKGYVDAVKSSPPAFGSQLVRSLLLSQVRFSVRDYNTQQPVKRTEALRLLRRPWPKGSTSELLTKMEWHAGIAGNAFLYRNPLEDRLRLLRPDWTALVFGSHDDPVDSDWQLDAELLGYAYQPGGFSSGKPMQYLLPDHVAHWSPLPDPVSTERGMSWLTPVVREVVGDVEATKHKTAFFRNGATPNVVVKNIPAKDPTAFEKWVAKFEKMHGGVDNAYKTLYLASGADFTVVGSKLGELDYKAIQGASETRISVASRVPAAVLGISEGLAGSALNAGNYGAARRNLADGWFYPTLESLVATIAQIIPLPDTEELWHVTSGVPFLREDAKDAADIMQIKASTLRSLVEAGFDPATAVAAVEGQDITTLEHTGNVSVQLQPAGQARALGEAIAAIEKLQAVIERAQLGPAEPLALPPA